jgi:hyperosmotically inducible periplasmic protein
MTKQRIISALSSALIAAVLGAYPVAAAQNTSAKAPDNTAINKRDKSKTESTADQGKNSLSDRELAAHIRRDVVKDKNLSSYAHNVKIIADHGKVTLKGPVRSDDEKRTVEEYARKYAADGSVTNELSVKAESK